MQSLGLSHQRVAGRILDYYLDHPVPPLLILTGPRGTGKLDAAHRFIQTKLCEVGTGCGTCSDCRLFARSGEDAHPDFIQFPAEKTTIGDSRRPDPFTVRWLLQSRLPFAPYHAKTRFILFPAAELILHEAEAALLKTLEEPPDHTRFIFIVESPDFLKETILSRGVRIPFYHIALRSLEEKTGIRDVHELEILGGSFELLDMVQSELFQGLKMQVDDALSHQLGMLELESYIREEPKRTSELKELDYSYEDFLTCLALLLLQKTRRMTAATLIAETVESFLKGIRMGQGGMTPFHLSRLFFHLHRILYEAPGV